MNATAALPVVGVDLAKSVFQLAIADGSWRVVEQQRLCQIQASCLVERQGCQTPLNLGSLAALVVPIDQSHAGRIVEHDDDIRQVCAMPLHGPTKQHGQHEGYKGRSQSS